jgi:predicted permease
MHAAPSVIEPLCFVAIGALLRVAKVVAHDDARTLGQLVIKVTLPATCLLAVLASPHGLRHGLTLAVFGAAVPLALVPVALLLGRTIDRRRKLLGVVVCSASVANLGLFLYPFVDSLLGDVGLSILVFFDIGNTVVAYSVTLVLARRFGDESSVSIAGSSRLILGSIPLWALMLGVAFRLLQFDVPDLGGKVLEAAKACNTPLTMTMLGIVLRPRLRVIRLTVAALFVRHGLGTLLSGIAAYVGMHLFGFSTIEAQIVLLAGGMPVGMIVLVYAINESLDVEFGASLVSLSLLLGFVQVIAWSTWVL